MTSGLPVKAPFTTQGEKARAFAEWTEQARMPWAGLQHPDKVLAMGRYIAELREREAALVAALRKYGSHASGCPYTDRCPCTDRHCKGAVCDCGYSALLAKYEGHDG